MIISKTPYRISFFGGGSDYHSWYQDNGGAVLSTTINHYCYLNLRFLPPFFQNKYRIVWNRIEELNDAEQIEHPAVRACLEYLNMERGIELHHQGGLPARSGLGSSSTFTVGLLNALYALRGELSTKKQLACEAVEIERDILKENVGVQDQIAAAYGGFNKISLNPDGDFSVDPLTISAERKHQLEENILLFFTGISRTASNIAESKIKAISSKKADLNEMVAMVDQAQEILANGQLADFGKLLHESWQIKRSISNKISNEFIDQIYSKAIKAGALGGKLLGAGGGGFIMFFVDPGKQMQVLESLKDLLLVPVKFDQDGAKIIYYNPDSFSRTSLLKRDYAHLQQQDAKRPRRNKLKIVK